MNGYSSMTTITFRKLARNGLSWARLSLGDRSNTSGSTHAEHRFDTRHSIEYIKKLYSSYMDNGKMTEEDLRGKRFLEIGPGDSFGVALLFLAKGVNQVVAGRVTGVVVWVLLACWPLNGFAVDRHFDTAEASPAIGCHLRKFASSRSRLVHSSSRSIALSEAIYQNTPGNSQGSPVGLSWDTDTSSTKTVMPPPSGWSALTGWAQVYQEAGAPVSPSNASDAVQVQDFTTYVLLTNGSWVEVQSQTQAGISGAHYVADFSGDAHIPFNMQLLPDGSLSIDAPTAGYNDHFFPQVRGTFTPGTVAGVFVEAEMKTNDLNANLVAQLGADWWRNAGAQYAGLDVNNTAVGLNDWTKLTTQWQTLYYSSLSPDQLEAAPPPHLLSTSRPCR